MAENQLSRFRNSFIYRTSDGTEIDLIVDHGDELIPIEVKWTEKPSMKNARHLRNFINEHASRCFRGYIVSHCPYPLELDAKIRAIP